MAFAEKQITVQFSLANGQFQGGGNSADIAGLRVACQIEATAGASQSTMEMAIYGMDLSLMNQLTVIGPQLNQRYKNGVEVFATDENGTALVFSGVVFTAYLDGQSMPETCLRVIASPGAFESVNPLKPISIQGSADAAGLMSQLAGLMGLSFQNNGVSVKLSNPYYAGSTWEAALEIAEHGNFDVAIDRKTMVISPRGTPEGGNPITLSAANGSLVGYPSFVESKVIVKALFNSAVKLLSQIRIDSALAAASGEWQVTRISYDLESVTPRGNWFMNIEAIRPGTQ